jgi:hypothetical protein
MLVTFSFELYFKSYRWFTDWSLEFLEIAFRSLSSAPACLLCFPRRRTAPPAASPANSNFAFASRWHPRVAPEPTHRPPCSRWCSPTVPRTLAASRAAQAAATATPPWRARCRAPALDSSRAAALQVPQKASPLAFSLTPHSHTPEHAAAPPRTPASPGRRRNPSSALPLPQSTPPVALP